MIKTFGEWHKQSALFVALPHKNTDWKAYLDEISLSYRKFIKSVSKFQKVITIAPNFTDFKRICSDLQNVEFVKIDTNDTWIRDFGTIDIEENGEIVGLNFIFNAWGDKFQSSKDNAVNKTLFKKIGGNLKDINLILEGGSIDFNGNGYMLTTKTCLLNKNRNNLTQDELDQRLREIFGLKKIFWLNHGFIQGDDTDSHIDTLARFIDENIIAFSVCEDKNDPHYDELNKMKDEILSFGFDSVELPIPKPIFYENMRLPATYANFVFINDALIVPTYNDKNDEIVMNRLQKALPNREIIGVDARVFIRQHGSLHCSCQNHFEI